MLPIELIFFISRQSCIYIFLLLASMILLLQSSKPLATKECCRLGVFLIHSNRGFLSGKSLHCICDNIACRCQDGWISVVGFDYDCVKLCSDMKMVVYVK